MGCSVGGRLGHSYRANPAAATVVVSSSVVAAPPPPPFSSSSSSSSSYSSYSSVVTFDGENGIQENNSLEAIPTADVVVPTTTTTTTTATATTTGTSYPPQSATTGGAAATTGPQPATRVDAVWPFRNFGVGPLSRPSSAVSYTPYQDPPHMLAASAPSAVAAAAAAAGSTTWELPLSRTPSHAHMRQQGQSFLNAKARANALSSAGLPPGTTAVDDPSLLANSALVRVPPVASKAALGKPWLRSPRDTPASPPVTSPKLITHALFNSRRVTKIFCGAEDTYLFSRMYLNLVAS